MTRGNDGGLQALSPDALVRRPAYRDPSQDAGRVVAHLERWRAWLPQTQSFLMGAETLLAHRDRWGTEPTPTRSALTRPADDERTVYTDLVTDRYSDQVRLEQERIDWAWTTARWLTTDVHPVAVVSTCRLRP